MVVGAWEDALIQAEFTRKYWGHVNVSDRKPGSTWERREVDGPHEVRLVGKVIEFVLPRRMVSTWAKTTDAATPAAHSRVIIELEPIEGMVRAAV